MTARAPVRAGRYKVPRHDLGSRYIYDGEGDGSAYSRLSATSAGCF